MVRSLTKHRQPIDEEQSYLTSVSDLMSGLMFIFMLMLVSFAIRYTQMSVLQQEVAVAQAEVIAALTESEVQRTALLVDLERRLLERGVEVRVDIEQGILRLPESILFPSGSAELNEEGRNALSILASVLAETIPCYAADAPPYCPEDLRGEIETIFIEGHTDNVPINTPRYPDNWTLSTARAIRTYQVLTEESPSLDRYRNRYGRPLFTVSGYADRRPVASNDTEDGRRLNRRIDLRFVMVSPQTPEIVRTIQERLYGSESGLPRD